ncbi:hypothetical protein P171DRAFT_492212 [Karstenula rhodostoma CBS 690.94]|uniref:Uncharacterized protein n=1 Tax=Karstenula rhodostoma CBS 690.94 TaxID=1392251 RepID=A0A9P4P506_9PLEO|nr:hypothetical protein P171DRAFT_492212 [Karstenula rhodostoma CBS 690.94]
MAKGRVRQILLTIFRVIQFVLSLVALVCGIYITYVYYDMASSAHDLLEAIDTLDPENDGVQILEHSLVPVLHHFDGTPMRAILIFVAALWSTLSIIYLFFADRAARHSLRDLKRNSRTARVMISVPTLILWIAAIICSALLTVEFGVFALVAGPETKVALTTSEKILLEAMQQIAESVDTISDAMNIVSSIMTIGFMAILLLGSSIVNTKVELWNCIIACCMSGKGMNKKVTQDQMTLEKGGVQINVASV